MNRTVFKKTISFHWINDIASTPSCGYGIFNRWRHNLIFFKYTWKDSLFSLITEPVIYLLAIGWGVGHLIKNVESLPYIDFFIPALIINTAMFVSFMETSYGVYAKLFHSHDVNLTLTTPITPDEVALGDLLWATTKGVSSSIFLIIAGYLFGFIQTPMIFPVIIFIFLTSWVFGALGLLVATYVKSQNSIVYSLTGIITLASFFCGTYFPLNLLPQFIQKILFLFPLTHSVLGTRQLMTADWTPSLTYELSIMLATHVLILLIYAIVLTNWSVRRFRRIILSK